MEPGFERQTLSDVLAGTAVGSVIEDLRYFDQCVRSEKKSSFLPELALVHNCRNQHLTVLERDHASRPVKLSHGGREWKVTYAEDGSVQQISTDKLCLRANRLEELTVDKISGEIAFSKNKLRVRLRADGSTLAQSENALLVRHPQGWRQYWVRDKVTGQHLLNATRDVQNNIYRVTTQPGKPDMIMSAVGGPKEKPVHLRDGDKFAIQLDLETGRPVQKRPSEIFNCTRAIPGEEKSWKTLGSAQIHVDAEICKSLFNGGKPSEFVKEYFSAATAAEREQALLNAGRAAQTDPRLTGQMRELIFVDAVLRLKDAKSPGDAEQALTDMAMLLPGGRKLAMPEGQEGWQQVDRITKAAADFIAYNMDKCRNGFNPIAAAKAAHAQLFSKANDELGLLLDKDLGTANQRTARQKALEKLEQLNLAGKRNDLIHVLKEARIGVAVADLRSVDDVDKAAESIAVLLSEKHAGNSSALQFFADLARQISKDPDKYKQLAHILQECDKQIEGKQFDIKGIAKKLLSQKEHVHVLDEFRAIVKSSPRLDRLDLLRTRQITQALSDKSSLSEVEQSVKALKDEQKHGNAYAREWLHWGEITLAIKSLGDSKSTDKACECVLALLKEEKDPIVRAQILGAVLLGDDDKACTAWRNIMSKHGFQKPLPLAGLDALPHEQQEELKLALIKAARERGSKEGISVVEASTLALALASTQSKAVTAQIRNIFKDVFEHQDNQQTPAERKSAAVSAERAITGIFDAMTLAPSPRLVLEYSRGIASRHNRYFADQERNVKVAAFGDVGSHFKEQCEYWLKLAEAGDKQGLSVVCGLAGGLGRHNSLVNPAKTGTDEQLVPGDALARRAQKVLLQKASENSHYREIILGQLSDKLQPQYFPIGADDKLVHETLGMVAALPGDIPAGARTQLYDGLVPVSGAAHESAVKGMMALACAGRLNDEDSSHLFKSFSPKVREQLEQVVDKLPTAVGRRLMNELACVARDGSQSFQNRVDAVAAMDKLGGRFATVYSISVLSDLRGQESKAKLQAQAEKEFVSDEGQLRAAKLVQQLLDRAGGALLSIVEHSQDTYLKTKAFAEFASKGWCTSTDKYNPWVYNYREESHWVERVKEIARQNPDNVTIQGAAARFSYSSEQVIKPTTARIAYAFQTMSDHLSDEQVLDATRRAVSNYGSEEIKEIPPRVALFNSLPPELRAQLTGSKECLKDGQVFSLEGRTVDAKTYNELPKEVRKQLFGTDEPLKEPTKLNLQGKDIDYSTFALLPPHVRRYIYPRMDLKQGESIPYRFLEGKSLDARTFNRLHYKAREALTKGRKDYGSSDFMEEGMNVPNLADRFIPAKHFNELSPSQKRALTGSDADLPKDATFDLSGRSLEAAIFNRMPAHIRKELTGSDKELPADSKLSSDQLKGKVLTSLQFNSLEKDVRRQLSGSDERIPEHSALPMAGRSIEAETFNRLPPQVRFGLIGTVVPLAKGRVVRDLSTFTISAKQFNELSEESRANLSATTMSLDSTRVLGQLGNRSLESREEPGSFLLEKPPQGRRLEERFYELKKQADEELKKEQEFLKALEKIKEQSIDMLGNHAVHGLNWWNKFIHALKEKPSAFLDSIPGLDKESAKRMQAIWKSGLNTRQKEFIREQAGNLKSVEALTEALQAQKAAVARAQGKADRFSIIESNYKFVRYSTEGKVYQADAEVLSLLRKYGRSVIGFAPDIARAVLTERDGVNANPFRRMKEHGRTQFDRFQVNDQVGDKDGKGISTCMEMLKSVRPLLKQGTPEAGACPADGFIVCDEALLGFDQDPTIQRMQKFAEDVSLNLNVLRVQLESILEKKGSGFDSFKGDAQKRAKQIEETFKSVKKEDLELLRKCKQAFENVLKTTKIKDQRFLEPIQTRLRAVDDLLKVLDPEYPKPKWTKRVDELKDEIKRLQARVDVPTPKDEEFKHIRALDPDEREFQWKAVIRPLLLKKAYEELSTINPDGQSLRQQINSMLQKVQEPDFKDNDDFEKWLRTDGLRMGASILCCAVGSLLGGLPGAAVGGALGAEGGAELSYQAGWSSTGARFFEKLRGTKVLGLDGAYRNMEWGGDVIAPLVVESYTGFLTLFAASTLGSTLGTALGKMTAPVRRLFLSENQAALAQLSKQTLQLERFAAQNSAFRQFCGKVSAEVRQQGLFCSHAHLLEQGLHAIKGKPTLEQLRSGEAEAALANDSAVTSFLVQVGLTALHRGWHVAKLPRVPRLNSPHLAFGFECNSLQEKQAYIKQALKNGSQIEATKDGFLETTRHGLKVKWTETPGLSHRSTPFAIEPSLRHEREAGRHRFGPSDQVQHLTELDRQLQKLSDDAFWNHTDAAKALRKAHKLLLEDARVRARRLGIPESLITSEFIKVDFSHELFGPAGAQGPQKDGRWGIEVNIKKGYSATGVLEHELMHLKRDLLRTAVNEADPKAAQAAIMESVLSNVGNGRRRIFKDPATGIRDISTTRAELSEPGKSLLRDAIREYLQAHPNMDLASLADPQRALDLLGQKKFKSLIAEIGGLDRAGQEITRELSHYLFVCDHATIGKEYLAKDANLRSAVEEQATRLRLVAELDEGRARLSESGKTLLNGAIKEYLEANSDFDINTLKDAKRAEAILCKNRFKQLVRELGTVEQACRQLSKEVAHRHISAPELKPEAKRSRTQQIVELLSGKGSLRNSPELKKAYSGISDTTTGIYDRTTYRATSPEEMAARRAEITANLRDMLKAARPETSQGRSVLRKAFESIRQKWKELFGASETKPSMKTDPVRIEQLKLAVKQEIRLQTIAAEMEKCHTDPQARDAHFEKASKTAKELLKAMTPEQIANNDWMESHVYPLVEYLIQQKLVKSQDLSHDLRTKLAQIDFRYAPANPIPQPQVRFFSEQVSDLTEGKGAATPNRRSTKVLKSHLQPETLQEAAADKKRVETELLSARQAYENAIVDLKAKGKDSAAIEQAHQCKGDPVYERHQEVTRLESERYALTRQIESFRLRAVLEGVLPEPGKQVGTSSQSPLGKAQQSWNEARIRDERVTNEYQKKLSTAELVAATKTPGHPLYEAQAELKRTGKELIEHRLEVLQDELDKHTRLYGQPQLKVVLTESGTIATHEFGEGTICISKAELLQGGKTISERIALAAVRNALDGLILRSVMQAFRPPLEFATIEKAYMQLTGCKLQKHFYDKVIKQQATVRDLSKFEQAEARKVAQYIQAQQLGLERLVWNLDGTVTRHTGDALIEANNVSDRFKGIADQALLQLPAGIRQLLLDQGAVLTLNSSVIRQLPHLKGKQPRGWQDGTTYGQVAAIYEPSSKQMIVAEGVHGSNGQWRAIPEEVVHANVRHEVGHAVDEALGGFSRSQQFIDAYNRDCAQHHSKLTARERSSLKYLLQSDVIGGSPGEAGRSEAFSEIFAEMYGGDVLNNGELLRKAFPEVHKLMHAKLSQHNAARLDQSSTRVKDLARKGSLDLQPAPSHEKKASTEAQLEVWKKHNLKVLDLDASEAEAMDKAFACGEVKLAVLDRKFMEKHEFFKREQSMRPKTQHQLEAAEKYNPLKAEHAVIVVRMATKYGDQYHVINGNNRIYLFGSEKTNPKDLGIPVLLFNSPEALVRTLGHDARENAHKALPFVFD